MEQPKGDKQAAVSCRDPVKTFEGHQDDIVTIATFPDGEEIATGSWDKTIRIWRLKDGREMKKWVVKKRVGALVILRNLKGIHVVTAEGDDPEGNHDKTLYWPLWVRDAETGSIVAGPLHGHTNVVVTLDISPDGGVLASGSFDRTIILWDTKTWQRRGDPLLCGLHVMSIEFSPTSQLQFPPTSELGVATSEDIQIWDLDRRERIAQFKGHNNSWNRWLTWTPDGVHLLSAGDIDDPTIRVWDTSTWKQDGGPWMGHDDEINHIVLHPARSLLASASKDHTVRLWHLTTGTELVRYEHSDVVYHVAFSVDERFIFSGGKDMKISQWEIPEDVLAATRIVPLEGQPLTEAGPSRGKLKNSKGFLDMEVPGQRRNMAGRLGLDKPRPRAAHAPFQTALDADSLSSPRIHGFKNLFNRIQLSSDSKVKQKEHCDGPKSNATKVVDVPLGQATYHDYVASEEDGARPYSLFFCLSWLKKKEKKPDPLPQLYDVDLMNVEEEDPLDVSIPTRVRFAQQEDIQLTLVATQPQPETSYLAENEAHPKARSS